MSNSGLSSCEDLEGLYHFVVFQTKQALRNAGLRDSYADDIVQDIWVKIEEKVRWNGSIRHLRAYVRRMIENEITNFMRNILWDSTTVFPLPENEHGELYEGRMQIIASKGMTNPLEEIAQEQTEKFRVRDLVRAILALPTRQRDAMLLRLQPFADEIFELDLAFREAGVNLESIQPPSSSNMKECMKEWRRLTSSALVATAVFIKAEPCGKIRACDHTLKTYGTVLCARLTREYHVQRLSRPLPFPDPRSNGISSCDVRPAMSNPRPFQGAPPKKELLCA